MDRRIFVAVGMAGLIGAAVTSHVGSLIHFSQTEYPKVKNPADLEAKILNEFVHTNSRILLTKQDIEASLYELKNEGGSGAAFHIGRGYFLTAQHVMEEGGENLRLLPQDSRNSYSPASYRVIAQDRNFDLALLKAPVDSSELKPTMSLGHISKEETVSLFQRYPTGLFKFMGHDPSKRVEIDLEGVDYFNRSKKLHLGKIVVEENSDLLETEGRVLAYKDEFFQRVNPRYHGNSANESFSSICAGVGNLSGSPIFVKVGENKYELVGVTAGLYNTMNHVATPRNPKGFEKMQQTGVTFVHNESISKFIRSYLMTK